MRRQLVAVAMSGGVDSGYVALALQRRGFPVLGLTLRLTDDSSAAAAAAVQAAHLGIPHRVVEARAAFRREIITYFRDSYAACRTPNPCARCNPVIKFGLLLDRARALGATALATGHYVRRLRAHGRWLLQEGRDPRKEQSYFLFALSQAQLAAARFPLGYLTKETVRARAAAAGLPVRGSESFAACFVPRGERIADWLARHGVQGKPGPILSPDGSMLGLHQGLYGFTIGQRQGIGVAAAHPLYVTGFDAARNALLTGPDSLLWQRTMRVRGLHVMAWAHWPRRLRARVRVRYRAQPAAATLTRTGDDELTVHFDAPQRGLTCGQAAVCYARTRVLGGGWIDAVGVPETPARHGAHGARGTRGDER